jgi:hypothetical protein
VIDIGIGLRAEFRYRLAIHFYLACGDQLFGVAPGCDACGSDDFLETFKGHVEPIVLQFES